MNISGICVSYFENFLVTSMLIFNWFVCFLIFSCLSSLYIIHTNSLPEVEWVKYFSCSFDYLCIWMTVYYHTNFCRIFWALFGRSNHCFYHESGLLKSEMNMDLRREQNQFIKHVNHYDKSTILNWRNVSWFNSHPYWFWLLPWFDLMFIKPLSVPIPKIYNIQILTPEHGT